MSGGASVASTAGSGGNISVYGNAAIDYRVVSQGGSSNTGFSAGDGGSFTVYGDCVVGSRVDLDGGRGDLCPEPLDLRDQTGHGVHHVDEVPTVLSGLLICIPPRVPDALVSRPVPRVVDAQGVQLAPLLAGEVVRPLRGVELQAVSPQPCNGFLQGIKVDHWSLPSFSVYIVTPSSTKNCMKSFGATREMRPRLQRVLANQ